ncbi:hypothetical protein GOV09_01555 [Candidatus Woesearchaeota archaeon]|nr:hypothetical protein [Candidatus Woesearchaeota archaeon]
MVSAIVMAGYRKEELADYQRQLSAYGEQFDPGYKAIKDLKIRYGRGVERVPLILPTLQKLDSIEAIDEIVIVGDRNQLEGKLHPWLRTSRAFKEIIEQTDPLPEEAYGTFTVGEDLPTDSIAGNAVKAYMATGAYGKREHALFMACDSPLTSREGIENFLKEIEPFLDWASVISPIISMVERPAWRKAFHRKYLFLVNDTAYDLTGRFRTWVTHRHGFRIGSYIIANPFDIDIDMANTFYSMRKLLSNAVQHRLKTFLREFGLGKVISKYSTKKLTVKELAKAIGQTLCIEKGALLIPITDVGASYDYDNTQEDRRGLEDLMDEGVVAL